MRFLKLALLTLTALAPLTALADQNALFDLDGTPILLGKSGHKLIIGSVSTDGMEVQVAGTPIQRYGSGGQTIDMPFTSTYQVKYPAAAVITPDTAYPTPPATPCTGSAICGRNNIIAAANPTATFVTLPLATAHVGKVFGLTGMGANPVAIAPISGDSVNALAAGTPFSCATGTSCECRALKTGVYGCK